MKITKGKIILLILVIYFTVFAIININKEKDLNADMLKDVTIVKNGIVNPENEGKLVLVSGKIETDNLVSFLELDESFGTIKISRKVEDYIKVKDEDTGKYELEWVEREEPFESEDYLKTIVSEEKISNIKIGEFVLDKHGLKLVPADRYYAKQEQIGELITTGIDYSRDPHEEDLQEGDMKITYKFYDLEKNPYMTILAVQKGNSFVPYKVDKKTEIYQLYPKKIDTIEGLEKQFKKNVKTTTRGKFLFIAMIIGVGVVLILDNRKKEA